ncbi:centromere protein K isoform X1 [Myxocyprinus asiaticus]|uniref:centromere protein K isoform X1 n=1 Tax=Myxocyprinus asiaticus TaxID=70543 RepID=UPI0022231543|nr:centromere protein K isoform X1 [Myxocyprinus asiaticus]XP_051560613.1 centromere protein K isoform X1 [Myxocyprinus asiaticus]
MDQDIQSAQCSEEAKALLLDDCEEQFGLLQKLQNEIILADTETNDDESNEALNRLNAITAELEQWQEMDPKLLPTNPEVLLAVGKEELQTLNSQLKMVLSYSQAKLDALKEILKREQTWLAEKKEVLNAVSERVTTLRHENEKLSEHSILQDMKRKINNLKDYHSSLMETLSDMLAEHFPLPDPQGNGTKKKRAAVYDADINLISLSEIIEKLTNKTLETPHDPYVTTDDTFWPPYMEMLLRNGIAIRHPDDCNKIRLELFV